MGKTRDLFKKIRDTKETFHAKMGSIKDRNGMGHGNNHILAQLHQLSEKFILHWRKTRVDI